MKEIRTEDAVGHILCHDITQIIKDVKKGVLFKKGHIVREEDIPLLLSVGKEHLYVWEKKEGILHENEGAEILYKICAGDSDTMHGSDIKEGKIELRNRWCSEDPTRSTCGSQFSWRDDDRIPPWRFSCKEGRQTCRNQNYPSGDREGENGSCSRGGRHRADLFHSAI